MKHTIAGIIAGLVLGVTGTALGGANYYWSDKGSGYTCEGVTAGAVCRSGLYSIGITKSYVYVRKGINSGPTYVCHKQKPWASCFQD